MADNTPDFSPGVRSNAIIAITALLLGLVILFDGKLYNKTPTTNAIHALDTADSITLSDGNSTLLAFERQGAHWLITTPYTAPAIAERMAVLLDTNQHSSRRYTQSEVPFDLLFKDTVTLNIDNHQFHFGAVEPVSQLRYVLAGDHIYLQPDYVLPLLKAGHSAFIDLQVTDQVLQVTIEDQLVDDTGAWSALRSLDIVTPPSAPALASIAIKDANHSDRHYTLHQHANGPTLVNDTDQFGYLLSATQAAALGVARYLPGSALN